MAERAAASELDGLDHCGTPDHYPPNAVGAAHADEQAAFGQATATANTLKITP